MTAIERKENTIEDVIKEYLQKRIRTEKDIRDIEVIYHYTGDRMMVNYKYNTNKEVSLLINKMDLVVFMNNKIVERLNHLEQQINMILSGGDGK